MTFYIAALNEGLQDFRHAAGPFDTPAEAAAMHDALVASLAAHMKSPPYELADVGSFFVMVVYGLESLNCVIGPYKSHALAKRASKDLIRGGGVFEDTDDHFIGVVRFIKQDGPDMPQIAIMERLNG